MIVIRLMSFSIAILGIIFFVTQIILPAFMGRTMFPLFRSKTREAESKLQEARRKKYEAKLQKQAAKTESEYVRIEQEARHTIDDTYDELIEEEEKHKEEYK